MQVETWKITGGGFHFGKHGLGQEETQIHLPSDSLMAALTARLAELQGAQAVEDWMKPFCEGEPPFVITSAFPFAGRVRFFPWPALIGGGAPGVRAKDLKSIRFVSEALFRRLLKGESLAQVYPQALKLPGLLVHIEEAEGLPEQIRQGKTPLWQEEKRPRVALSRVEARSNLFHSGRVNYAQGCGLWFGVRWLQADAQKKELLAKLLADLGDAGLGGERNAGYGACSIRPWEALELPEASQQVWITLSRYLPRPEEIQALQDKGATYSLVRVGGWLESPARRGQRRKAITMLAEGAVLGPTARRVPGQVVDVRPCYPKDPDPVGHAVYRSGLAFAVSFPGGER